jgi:DNA-binding LacI/PurR family transcriptional regulator
MTSLRHLAELAGVSEMSVSRALRDVPGVSAETRARIKALAEEYHFRPDLRARGQLSGNSRILGCILPSITYGFYARMLNGVLRQAVQDDYRVITFQTYSDPQETLAAIYHLIDQRVDALLLNSVHPEPLSRKVMAAMRSHHMALVSLDATPTALPVDEVRLDEEHLAESAVEYLYELGHRRIGFLGVDRMLGRKLRLAALQRSFQHRGLTTDYFTEPTATSLEAFHVPSAGFKALLGRCASAFLGIMQSPVPPTALIVSSEPIIVHIHQTALRHGITIPQQLSLLGYVDFDLACILTPAVTTVGLQPEEIGRQAVIQAITRREARAKGEELPPVLIKVPGTIAVRESCGPAPK